MIELIDVITQKLHQHHILYRYPVQAEWWEDLFDQSINSNNSNWNMGSHSPGADVVCSVTGTRYQNKTGAINLKTNKIKWSGHRTTKHETLDEKIKFLSESHYDKFAMLARIKSEWDKGLQKYYFLMFDANLLDYKKLNWVEYKMKNGNVGGWKGTHPDLPYSAQISLKMSDQLWTTANISYLGTLQPIVINHDTQFFKYQK